MTLVCCTLTNNFALITGDTLITNNETNTSRTVRKVFKFSDILVGASGSGGAVEVIPAIMETYQNGTAHNHMQQVANLFTGDGEKVMESSYSQFLYVSKDEESPFLGIVDTKGDHQILRKDMNDALLIWQGIGEPNLPLLQSCIPEAVQHNFDLDIAKKIHEDYISKVSERSNTVNSDVIHECFFF